MKTRFILNPRSWAGRQAEPVIRAFPGFPDAELIRTERPRHATELAAEAARDGCELVVAVGGDGTMNEVAAALIHSPVVLGLVPCGSGNGLGRYLGVHGSVRHALEILVHGRTRLIDSGTAAGHPFFTVAGLGFEAVVADRFNALKKRGFARYLTSGARLLREFHSEDFTIRNGGGTERLRVFTLAVGNADQYGNNAHIAPSAKIDDGLLNLTAVPPPGVFGMLPMLWRLFRGTLEHDRNILFRTGDHFVVERPAPGPLHTDGETHAAGTSIEFRVHPASLRIRVPATPKG